jgi:hypothetical protein
MSKAASILLLALSLSCSGATYYVATNGNNSASGAVDAPWLTLQKAFDVASAGDTISLKDGLHSGVSYSARSGTENSPITLTGSANAIIGNDACVFQHSYHFVRDIKFTGECIRLDGTNAHHNTFSNLLVFNNTGIGIYWINTVAPQVTNGPSFNTVRSCVFSNAISYHYLAVGASHNLIESNLFTVSNGYDAIRMFGLSNIVRCNVFDGVSPSTNNNNHCDIIQTWAGSVDTFSKGTLFEKNFIVNSDAQLCNLTDDFDAPNVTGWIIRNNVVAYSRGQANVYMPGSEWYNNTFYHCQGPAFILFRVSDDRGSAHNTRFMNNIMIECGNPPEGANYGVYSLASGLTNCIGDWNFYAGPGGSTKNLAETNGVNGGLPYFVDAVGRDYRLQIGSPARGAGLDLSSYGFTTDIAGTSRGTSWDIGAYQSSSGTPARVVNAARAVIKSITP